MKRSLAMKISVVIPYYNEEKAFFDFLPHLVDECSKIDLVRDITISSVHLVIIDDGSIKKLNIQSDLNTQGLNKPFGKVSIHILRHKLNLGQGAALQTGIKFATHVLNSDFFVTLDSDGQHNPKDISSMLDTLVVSNSDIVFGNRFFNKELVRKIPFTRVVTLKLALYFERLITKIKVGDAHNGFRCFNKKFAAKLKIQQNRMAHATEFKQITKKFKFKYTESPVNIVYSDYSISKGQSNWGAFRILKDLALVYVFGEEI